MLKMLKKHEDKIITVLLCVTALVMIGAVSVYIFENRTIEKDIDEQLRLNDERNLISVYVGGEVKNPGAYSLKAGARVGDAIEAAGGFGENANKKINVALLLSDGDKVIVSDKSGAPNDGLDYRVNINTATLGEIMSLDGIGEKTAERIINYRENNGGFSAPEEIMEVSGIGEKLYEKIKDIIVTE